MLEIWRITAWPKPMFSGESNLHPGSIALLAWRENSDERYCLVLENDGHSRAMFASVIGSDGADEIVATLASDRIVDLPTVFTTRQLNMLGFRLSARTIRHFNVLDILHHARISAGRND